MLKAAAHIGLTDADLCYMSLQDVVWYIEGKGKAGAWQLKEMWRMTRRLCFVTAKTMGGFKGNEDGLWHIDGDAEPVGLEKIEEWRKKLDENGKYRAGNVHKS